MDKVESYLLLFTDSLVGNLALNPKGEFVIYTMNLLGCYNKKYMIFIVIAAALVSTCTNYLIGKVLTRILVSYVSCVPQRRNNLVVKYLLKYNIFLLILAFLPNYGKFIQVFAGFFDYGIAKVLITSILSKFIYYMVLIY
ncbi:MAG: hypothetical protein ACRYE9_05975 [Janthinobacterium lividum]